MPTTNSTPLSAPVTLNLTLETQEDVLALFLRANLDDGNLRDWYHSHRNRPGVRVPSVRMTGIYRVLKDVMDREGFSHEGPAPETEPAPAHSVDVTMG